MTTSDVDLSSVLLPLTSRKNHMMKDGISEHNSQLSVLSRAFSPRAIEKSKTTEVLWSTCTSFPWKKPEPRNGLNINDLLRNSLNNDVDNGDDDDVFTTSPWKVRLNQIPFKPDFSGFSFFLSFFPSFFLLLLSISDNLKMFTCFFRSSNLHVFYI